MILKCFCDANAKGDDNAAKFQDSKYGRHQRVFNQAVGPNKSIIYRCTICKQEKEKGK